MEDQLAQARSARSIGTVALRFGGIYGPDVASLQATVKMLRARRIFLPRNTRNVMTFVHVDDAAAATIAALEHPSPSAVYNIIDDEPMPLPAFLDIVAAAVGAPPPRSMPVWIFRFVAPLLAEALGVRMPLSNAKAKRELGWRLAYPRVSDGMRDVVAHLKMAA
jgi:nucleoside-diphosphate-sugar epimerase